MQQHELCLNSPSDHICRRVTIVSMLQGCSTARCSKLMELSKSPYMRHPSKLDGSRVLCIALRAATVVPG